MLKPKVINLLFYIIVHVHHDMTSIQLALVMERADNMIWWISHCTKISAFSQVTTGMSMYAPSIMKYSCKGVNRYLGQYLIWSICYMYILNSDLSTV